MSEVHLAAELLGRREAVARGPLVDEAVDLGNDAISLLVDRRADPYGTRTALQGLACSLSVLHTRRDDSA